MLQADLELMYFYEDFHIVQNLRRKLKGDTGRGIRALWKWVTKTFVFIVLIFDIYHVGVKMVTYVMSYTEYTSLVKIFLKFDLI